MSAPPVLMSAFTLALLLPVLYGRYRRRSGAQAAGFGTKRGRLLVMGMASIVLVGVLGGAAMAANGDKDGSKTGTQVSNLIQDTSKASAAGDKPSADDVAAQTEKNRTSINMTWLMLGGILVLFMQAGFALVETGFTRAKNAAHTMMMNMVIFALGVVGWFVCGYALMFGAADQSKILGLTPLGSPWHIGSWNILAHSGFFLAGHAYDVSVLGFFFFQLVFMDATATIPTGAMAERWKFSSFIVWGLFASMLLYPIYGNWVWGGGWLSQLGTLGPKWGHGAVDFAGSGVVHAMGGVAAFWGAKILGPRIGKFDKDGNPRAIPGHHLPMALLGTFILLVGWMGFNGGSTFAGTDLRLTVVIVNTILASAFGCLSCMFIMWRLFGKPDPSMTANGLLAGLVAITAPCAFVAPWRRGHRHRRRRSRRGRRPLGRAQGQGRRPGRCRRRPRCQRLVGRPGRRPVRRRLLRRRTQRRQWWSEGPVLRRWRPVARANHRRRRARRLLQRDDDRLLHHHEEHHRHAQHRRGRDCRSRHAGDGRPRLPGLPRGPGTGLP
jgi:ammonium transporter